MKGLAGQARDSCGVRRNFWSAPRGELPHRGAQLRKKPYSYCSAFGPLVYQSYPQELLCDLCRVLYRLHSAYRYARYRAAGERKTGYLCRACSLWRLSTAIGREGSGMPGSFFVHAIRTLMAKYSKVRVPKRNAYNTMETMGQSKLIPIAIGALIIGGLAGFWYGGSNG